MERAIDTIRETASSERREARGSASAKNPQGAKKLRELEEIRSLHASVANLAAAEVNEALSS